MMAHLHAQGHLIQGMNVLDQTYIYINSMMRMGLNISILT